MIFDKTRLAKRTLSSAAVLGVAIIALVLPALAANESITFTETAGPAGDTLTSSNLAAIITGSTDDWDINLSALGITLSSVDLPQQWREAAGDPGVNVLEIVPGTNNILNLLSEDTTPPGTPDNFCGTGSPLPDGTTCFIGTDANANLWFATVVERSAATTPEPASLLLSGLGLAGLAIAGMRRKRQS